MEEGRKTSSSKKCRQEVLNPLESTHPNLQNSQMQTAKWVKKERWWLICFLCSSKS